MNCWRGLQIQPPELTVGDCVPDDDKTLAPARQGAAIGTERQCRYRRRPVQHRELHSGCNVPNREQRVRLCCCNARPVRAYGRCVYSASSTGNSAKALSGEQIEGLDTARIGVAKSQEPLMHIAQGSRRSATWRKADRIVLSPGG